MMLGLSEAQEGVLTIVYKIAQDNNWKLDDTKDLRLLLQYVGDNKNDFITKYGNIMFAPLELSCKLGNAPRKQQTANRM